MIITTQPDKEKVKSILLLIKNREDFVKSIDDTKYSTIAAENHYEILKELATALLLLERKKAIGENAHKDLILEIGKNKEISEAELNLFDDLRLKRNRSLYEGKQINASYLENKKDRLIKLAGKLRAIVEKRITK